MTLNFVPAHQIHCFRRKIAGGVTSLCFNKLFYRKTVKVNSEFVCVSFKEGTLNSLKLWEMGLVFVSKMVLTWKNKLFSLCLPSDRFTPAHFWIGFNPKSVHPVPRVSDGQIPGDPRWLRVEEHQPVPGDPLRCPSARREALPSPRAACLAGGLERHRGSVRNPCSRQEWESCWSDDNNIHVLSCKAAYRVQTDTLISKENNFSIYMQAPQEKKQIPLYSVESLHSSPPAVCSQSIFILNSICTGIYYLYTNNFAPAEPYICTHLIQEGTSTLM